MDRRSKNTKRDITPSQNNDGTFRPGSEYTYVERWSIYKYSYLTNLGMIYSLRKLFFTLPGLVFRDHPLASDGTAQGFFQFPHLWTAHAWLISTCLIRRSHISPCGIFAMLSTGFPILATRKHPTSFLESQQQVPH